MFISLLLVLVALIVLKHFKDQRKFKNYPPGPPRWPLVGSLLSTPGELIHLHAEKHWVPKYGPLVGLMMGSSRAVVVACGAEEVLTILHHEHCQHRPKGHAFTERSFGKRLGIFFSNDSYWKEQRRFTLRQLRDLGFGKTKLEGVVLDEVNATVEAINRDGPEIQPNNMFRAPILNTLWWMMSGQPFARGTGASLDPRSQSLLNIMKKAMRNKRVGTAPCDIWPFLKYIAPEMSAYNEIYGPIYELYGFLREEIQNQRLKGIENSFMGKYTEEINKAPPGSGFTEESLLTTCLDLFMAGGESTANTLSYGLMYMAMYPEKQSKVHAELDAICVGKDKEIISSDISNLPYLEATLTEVMRINTIAPLAAPHDNVQDIELNGYTIPEGTLIMASIWHVLNDKKHWGDPEEFRPERFIDKDGKFVSDPWFVPFGVGKRNCIGESFATQVAYLFFANLMNRFKFLLPPGSERPSTIPDGGFTVSPQPFSVIAVPRRA